MLYELLYYISQLNIRGVKILQYVSFRTMAALMTALAVSIIVGKFIIQWLLKHQIKESVRHLGLEGEKQKGGKPTMGGLIILIAIFVPVLLLARLSNIYILLMLISTLWLGVLGLIDDFLKIKHGNKVGLSGKIKIVAQIGLGLMVGLVIYLSPDAVMRENVKIQRHGDRKEIIYSPKLKSTQTTIPFLKNNNLDYRSLMTFLPRHYRTAATWILFVLVIILIITAVSNGSNLTDGLDGLAAGCSAIIGVVLGIFAYVSSHLEFAAYLNIMYVPGCEELTIFAGAFVGACMGFLWYNAFPAQVFMGDTGSLTLGGIIAVFAILIHKELLLPVLCGVFFVESLSVIVQVVYFKYTRKKYGAGKRIFKMTPLHHHFQADPPEDNMYVILKYPSIPLHESKIVLRFWLIEILLASLSLLTLKIR